MSRRTRIYHRYKYAKAVRCGGRDCVLIIYEVGTKSVSTVMRNETWYAKDVGLVKRDEYFTMRNTLTHTQTEYLIGE